MAFLQLSIGLSIKNTYEIEWWSVAWWDGAKEFCEKLEDFGTEWEIGFFPYWLLIPKQIL